MKQMDSILQGAKIYTCAKEREKLVDEFLDAVMQLPEGKMNYGKIAFFAAKEVAGRFCSSGNIPYVLHSSHVKTAQEYQAAISRIIEEARQDVRRIGLAPTQEDFRDCQYAEVVKAVSPGGTFYSNGCTQDTIPIGLLGTITNKSGGAVVLNFWSSRYIFRYEEIRPVTINVVQEEVGLEDLNEGDTFIVNTEGSNCTRLPKGQVFVVGKKMHEVVCATIGAYGFYPFEVSKVEAVRHTRSSDEDVREAEAEARELISQVEISQGLVQYRQSIDEGMKMMEERGFSLEEVEKMLAERGLEGVLR